MPGLWKRTNMRQRLQKLAHLMLRLLNRYPGLKLRIIQQLERNPRLRSTALRILRGPGSAPGFQLRKGETLVSERYSPAVNAILQEIDTQAGFVTKKGRK